MYYFVSDLGTPRHLNIPHPFRDRRHMSAYVSFANERRGAIKAQNPDCSNGEISKILSDMWKSAPDDVKKGYRDVEKGKWDTYKVELKAWKKKNYAGFKI